MSLNEKKVKGHTFKVQGQECPLMKEATDMIQFVTHSAQETFKAGYCLGGILKKGDVVCLTGALGTGKTAFAGGIAAALGIEGYVTSPTFTIVNEYNGKTPLYHFDVYRIEDPAEMFEIGFEEYIEGRGITVIEWAEIVKEILPAEHIDVMIKKDCKANPDDRILTYWFIGERYAQYERRLQPAGF